MDVVQKYEAAGIPLETIWLDIPYLNKYEDFTIDSVAFPDIKAYTNMLHKFNKHIVVILDVGISADDTTSKYF